MCDSSKIESAGIKMLYDKGVSVKEITQRLDISRSSVYNVLELKKRGIERRKAPRKIIKTKKLQNKEFYQQIYEDVKNKNEVDFRQRAKAGQCSTDNEETYEGGTFTRSGISRSEIRKAGKELDEFREELNKKQ